MNSHERFRKRLKGEVLNYPAKLNIYMTAIINETTFIS